MITIKYNNSNKPNNYNYSSNEKEYENKREN